MTLRRPKKPISPKVLALQDSLRRARGIRELQDRFLIVCEDDKSAPSYFHSLKKYYNWSATSIEVVGGGGNTQPIQVVKTALTLKNAANSENSGTEPFSQVWCVIDGDYGNKIPAARQLAEQNEIKLAITTKCFEYWLILHFRESSNGRANCKQVVSDLKALISDYSKGDCDFSGVVANVRAASNRARKLRNDVDRAEDQNPCSDLYLLIESLFKSKTV